MPGEVVVKVHGLKKYFEVRRGILHIGRPVAYVKAVDDVNFEIRQGEILGLVGESGCGKTTTGRLLVRLEDATAGNVFFLGRDIALLEGVDLKVFRRSIQMVFQDPYESLNPRTTVLQTVMEPLINHNIGKTFEERVKMVVKALEDAGLAPAREYLNRFPHELSGGQRQRVSVARALVISPKVIVADEPVSMLDVSIRAGVLNLMLDLRDKYHIPYLFITHDIAVARYVSDRLAVMYLGRVVELGETDSVIFQPKHPYTCALLSAVPVPDPEHKHGRITIKGEVPSAVNIPLGCRFRPRCPMSFELCGWEAKDLVAYLTEEAKVSDEKHPMARHIQELRPEGFSLVVSVKPDGSATAVRDFLLKEFSDREKNPMFRAVRSVEESLGDRVLEVRASSVKVPGDVVAQELLEALDETVDFRSADHPMYGTMLDARREGARVIISVGDQKYPIKNALGTVAGFLNDFVKHRRKTGQTEFGGVSRGVPDPSSRQVVVACNPARMSSRRVASELADMIARDYADAPESRFSILPPLAKGSKVVIRVNGPEAKWKEFAAELKRYLSSKSEGGNRIAKAAGAPVIKPVKGPSRTVVVRLTSVKEPPLFDIGGGHMVACYLFRPAAR